jgi:hypothetical protein
MKYFFCVLLLCFNFCQNINAQVTGGNAFQTQNIYTGYAVSGNDVVLPVYKGGSDIQGSPFFSKDWAQGAVTTTDKNTYSDKLEFMYDKTDNTLYVKNTDSNKILKADISKISSFSLITDKQHTFIKGDLVNRDYTGKFFEVLVLDEKKYSLFKLTRTEFQHAQTSAASQAMTESISPGKYVDNVTYFLYANNVLQQVELKKKAFVKAMNAGEDKAQTYIDENKGNFNESYVISMLNTLNSESK